MKHLALFLIILSVVTGCGHNRLLIDKSIGFALTVPCGDFGSFKVGIGSTETTTAELRGGSSLETETAEGSGLFSSQVGTTRVTKFKANQQANEGNIVKIITDPNVPEKSKLILSESLARASTAPEFKSGALQTREAVIYSDGYEGQLENDFQPTGIDRVGDNVEKTISKTVDNLNPFESLKEALSEGLGAINKTAAIALAIVVAIIILVVFLSVRKPRKPKNKKHRSALSTSAPTPEPPVMEKDPSDTSKEDEIIDVESSPSEPAEEEEPEEQKSWLTRGFLRLIHIVVDILTFWRKLKPSTQKTIIDGGVKTIFKKKRKSESDQK